MKKMVALFCVLLLAAVSVSALADEWPSKAITVVIPANPGGDTDTTSRAICESLTEILGVPVQVVNMSGGAGTLAMNDVISSDADGYKLIYHHADTVLGTLLGRVEVPWYEMFDIAAVTGGGSTNCIFVSKDSPYNSLEALFADAASRPGEVSFAMETGGLVHLLALEIERQAGVQFNLVDAGSSSDRITALLGGNVDVLLTVYGSAAGYVESGDFKCLGILAAERNENLPDVPTLAEAGVNATYEHFYYFGFKAGTDSEIVSKFAEAVKQAAYMEPYTKALNKYYFKANVRTGQDAVDYMLGVQEFFTPITEMLQSK